VTELRQLAAVLETDCCHITFPPPREKSAPVM